MIRGGAKDSLSDIMDKCGKYDQIASAVESCFPKSISQIKRLYGLLRQCEEEGLCNKHGAGFAKSFFLAIEEANVRFEADLDKYIEKVKHIEADFKLDPVTYDLVPDIAATERLFKDKELFMHYSHYYEVIDKMQKMMVMKKEQLSNLSLDAMENMLDEFADAALALCVYVSKQPDAEGIFKRDCSQFKNKRK